MKTGIQIQFALMQNADDLSKVAMQTDIWPLPNDDAVFQELCAAISSAAKATLVRLKVIDD